jgi:N-acetylmuramoyl-L-alanine amidase
VRLVPLLAVLLVACSVEVAPPPGDDIAVPATTSSTEAVVPSTATPSTTTGSPTTTIGVPAAGTTPTGVVVPVRSSAEGRYLVGTPCAAAAVVAAGLLTPLPQVDVLLDPGHGGEVETGAIGPNGVREADLNLVVARKLAAVLDERGIGAAISRGGDYRMAIAARVELAAALRPALFVSIHHNAGSIGPADEPGTIVFHQVDNEASRRAAGLAYEEMVAAFEPLDLPWVNSFEPGAFAAIRASDERDAYGVLRRNDVPAILTEALFIQNGPEAEALATDEVQDLEVEALANAIERFLTTNDPGSGFREPEVYDFPVSPTGGTAGCEDPDLGT